MRPISSLSLLTLGILSSWHVALFWLAVGIMVISFWDQHQTAYVLRNIFLILLCVMDYSLFQCTIGYSTQNADTEMIKQLVAWYAEQPATLLIICSLLLTAIETGLIWSIHRQHSTHITPASIKDMIETFPVGLCAFEPDGKIILRNKMMEQLSRSITSMPLLNGDEFLHSLLEIDPALHEITVSLPEYGVWTITKDEIRDEKSGFTLLIAYNVTEAYQKTQMLAERQRIVQELNRKLLEYNQQIEQLITQQEILNAKIHIHDELGSGLLAIKHYLVSGGSDQERAELLERLQENIHFLQNETLPDRQDDYTLVLSTAADLGISVQINGLLPQTEPNKRILATAIHECFTNIIRYTDGDTLYVDITEEEHSITARFTDNNTRPISEITESGGLRSLRDLTEQEGGRMVIITAPRYCLSITLPKENERNVL